MALREYRRKRDFSRSPEPRGATAAKSGNSFVVQKHQASRLHYDFRLEMDGVLVSWAVPKGPSLDPAEKRLAVHVEDHPLEYGGFEGAIPAGQYGAGTVIVWDRGKWSPKGDATQGLRSGKLSFTLAGEKLKGAWTLVRIGGRRNESQRDWLLIKERDAAPLAEEDVLEEQPGSVISGRTLEEVAAGRRPKAPAKAGKGGVRAQRGRVARRPPRSTAAGKRAPLPKHLDLQLATLTARPPEGDDWLHEIKLDGYRMSCRLDGKDVRFVSRNGQDWTSRLKSLANAVARLPARQALLDGEVVVLDEHGVSSFQALQNALGRRADGGPLRYYAFDLLHLDGRDLKAVPLESRKAALEALLASATGDRLPLHYVEHIDGSGAAFHREACRAGLEGTVSKRRDRPYVPGRGRDWLKSKCRQGQELVIGGFTRPAGSRVGLGALLVGYHDTDHGLRYAGRVGTGFDDRTLRDLERRLKALERRQSPFTGSPDGVDTRGVRWVRPTLVAQVEFSNWTRDGLVRHASFQGLRPDKRAADVRRETPAHVEK